MKNCKACGVRGTLFDRIDSETGLCPRCLSKKLKSDMHKIEYDRKQAEEYHKKAEEEKRTIIPVKAAIESSGRVAEFKNFIKQHIDDVYFISDCYYDYEYGMKHIFFGETKRKIIVVLRSDLSAPFSRDRGTLGPWGGPEIDSRTCQYDESINKWVKPYYDIKEFFTLQEGERPWTDDEWIVLENVVNEYIASYFDTQLVENKDLLSCRRFGSRFALFNRDYVYWEKRRPWESERPVPDNRPY